LTQEKIEVDILVIGSGVAGLSFALKAQGLGNILVASKRDLWEGSSFYAQGGVASVISNTDSFDAHIQDTIAAGAGLCNPDVVEMVVKSGPERIDELVKLGVNFTMRDDRSFDLGKEGGHSKRRILHSEDTTGKELENVLIRNCKKKSSIRFLEWHQAIDLVTTQKLGQDHPNRVLGAHLLDLKTGQVKTISAWAVVMATGGAGKVYLYTTNPDIATGDGVAMAWRSGAEIANMEFFQFHPTCLYHPEAKSFLISEAVRGEGAMLRRMDGERFMPGYHPMAELAPRDIVARAIDQEMKASGNDYVLLDLRAKPAEFIKERFPNIYKTVKQFGFDMAKEPIPVVPAAHYMCGGVKTDKNGATNITGLFAIGETACTGLHGANRLASNSLLEALVFADRASKALGKSLLSLERKIAVPEWDVGTAVKSPESVIVSHNWDEIRRTMWNYVGIVRTDKRLESAQQRLNFIAEEVNQYYWNFLITGDTVELRNIATIADIIIKSAIHRKESRGLHYNLDHLETQAEWHKDTIMKKGVGFVD
jgi:L-aspartate oxidase